MSLSLLALLLLSGCPMHGQVRELSRPLGVTITTTQHATPPTHGEGQAVTFGVDWRTASRTAQAIPSNAQAVTFLITQNGLLCKKTTLIRDPSITQPTQTVRLYSGDYQVEVRAFDTSTPSDASLVVASGISPFTVVDGMDTAMEVELTVAASPVPGIPIPTTSPQPSATPSSSPIPSPAPSSTTPAISSLSPANGGPGMLVTINGSNFGASSGKSFSVSFGGTIAVNPDRLDDSRIQVAVPTGASTGQARVTIGGVQSNGMAFQVAKTIDLTPKSLDLLLGGSTAPSLIVRDTYTDTIASPSITWGVAGSSVLVNDGSWKAVALGDSTLTVSSGNLKETASVHVFRIDGVTLSQDNLTLNAMPEVGDPDPGYQTSATLVATVLASDYTNRRVNWSSSNTGLVTVSSGVVQTVRGAPAGNAIITATSTEDPKMKATASVTVTIQGGLNVEVN